MMIKKYLKKVYMLFTHPYIFMKFTVKNNLFIGKRSDLKKINKFYCGNNVRFGNDLRINFFDNSKEKKLFVLDGAYFCNRISFIVGGSIIIKKNVLVASDVCFVSENHGINPEFNEPYKDQQLSFGEISVGEGTWIGEKAMILPGVTLGDGCIVMAGAVVTKSFPAYCCVGGVPAQCIKKYNFNTHQWERCSNTI